MHLILECGLGRLDERVAVLAAVVKRLAGLGLAARLARLRQLVVPDVSLVDAHDLLQHLFVQGVARPPKLEVFAQMAPERAGVRVGGWVGR